MAEFGDEVLALPDDEGFDLAAYLVPGLAVLLAAGALAFAVAALARRGQRRERRTAPGAADGAKRLDADLERYDL